MTDFLKLLYAPVAIYGLFAIATPALMVWVLVRLSRSERLTKDLLVRIGELDARLRTLSRERGEAPREAPREAPDEVPREKPRPAEAPPSVTPVAPAADGRRRFEESFTSRWLVWLGAVTLALGGTFLVKHSIDRGWLGPMARIVLGFVLGIVLAVAGEGLRRLPRQRAIAALRPDYVPLALTSAGLFIAFASIYAGYALYDLMLPMTAFALLALIAWAGVALSLVQGPFIAVLGLLGAIVAPLLVSTADPDAWSLFAYLAVLVSAAVALAVRSRWWWVGAIAFVGAGLWLAWWQVALWVKSDALALGLFLLVLAGAACVLAREAPVIAKLSWKALASPWLLVGAGGGLLVAIFTFALVRLDGYDSVSLIVLAVIAAGWLAAARFQAGLDGLAVLAAALSIVTIGLWHLPKVIKGPAPFVIIEGRGLGQALGPVVPPELAPFLAVSAAFAALFAVAGFVGLWGARRPWIWAAIAGATPLMFLAVAYWRVRAFEVDLAWAVAAIALSALALAAAARVAPHRGHAPLNDTLGIFAAAVTAAIALAAAMSLRQAWLTAALAAELPLMAWITGRLEIRALRPAALTLAAVVLVRLTVNVNVLDYPAGDVPGLGWVLYGYGLPALAFYLAARWFRESSDDLLVAVLEAGALVFVVLLVTLEIRDIVAGPLANWGYSLEERAMQTLAWLAIAYALHRLAQEYPRPVIRWGWRILASVGTGHAVLFLLLVNPLWISEPVGEMPVFNLLILAYGGPALAGLMFARALRRTRPRVAMVAATLGLIFALALITLEVRQFFQGSQLNFGVTSDREWYAYSLFWLMFAGILLAVGLARQSAFLRFASLVVVMMTVAKVFVWDMSALTGLFRVASFLGLGLTLVAIGYLYQRFVLPSARAGSPTPS